jgi:hypothetical protein
MGESRAAAERLEMNYGPRVSKRSGGMGNQHLGMVGGPGPQCLSGRMKARHK